MTDFSFRRYWRYWPQPTRRSTKQEAAVERISNPELWNAFDRYQEWEQEPYSYPEAHRWVVTRDLVDAVREWRKTQPDV